MTDLIAYFFIELFFNLLGRIFRAIWPFDKTNKRAFFVCVMFWISILSAIGLAVIDQAEIALALFVSSFIFMIVALVYDVEDHEIRKERRQEHRAEKLRLKM